jgi:MarR family transcriptional regulator for hemolysin
MARDRGDLQLDIAFKSSLMTRRLRARFAERVKSTSQTEARWSALYQLAREPNGLIQTELAERMGIQGPTLVRLLDALEEQKLVSRSATPEDRRAKRVKIEPAGRTVVGDLDKIAAELRDQAFSGIPQDDLLTTIRVLDRLANALEPDKLEQPDASDKVPEVLRG